MSGVSIPSGGLPENCFTGVYGSATSIVLGSLVSSTTTTCDNPSCTVTPTPTPTISTTPSLTPTISITPSITPTISVTPSITPSVTPSLSISPTISVTPTVSPSNLTCEDFEFEVTQVGITNTPTPSSTPTPTPSKERSDSGTTVVYVIDSGYFECGDILKLQDCSDSSMYYFVNGPLTFNGTAITINDIFTAELNGDEKCVTYVSDTNGSSTHFVSNISQIHTECCQPSPTPTPSTSTSLTPTPTPSITPSSTPRNGVSYVYTACSSNNMIVQTEEVSGVTSGQTFIYNGLCWNYGGFYSNPYHNPIGYIRTDYNGNYFGDIEGDIIFDSCEECNSSPQRNVTPSPTPTVTPSISITPSISVTPSITPTPSTTPNQDVNLDFDVDYRSGSTIATFTVIASEVLVDSLRVRFKNVLFNTSTQRDVELTATVDIPAGSISATTSASTVTDYADIQAYQTSYKDIQTTSSGVSVRNIDKYHRVNFIGKTTPVTSYYQFTDCCNTGSTKNLEVDRTSPWITDGYGVIIDGICYIPRVLGGDGSDGLYYGPDFKDCSFRGCQTCPSPTPSITPSITPTITPSITPTNPYYLVCDVVTREYTLICQVETEEYNLECDSEFLPTPSVTPTTTPTITPSVSVTSGDVPVVTVTPSMSITNSTTPTVTPSITSTITPSITVTPSVTNGDKTIYVYYSNL